MKSARVVWIVAHFEYLGPPYWLDEIVSHVASTRSEALRYIQEVHVDPGTWWGVQPFAVDRKGGERGPQALHSRTGTVMTRGYSLKSGLKKKGGTKNPPSRPS